MYADTRGCNGYPVAVTTSRVLSIALQDTGQPPLRPLPIEAAELLHDVDAPPRLVAHLRAVHDVAGQLLAWIAARNLDLGINPEAVLFGAATHDIGKVLHPAELTAPGAQHEEAGRELLMTRGIDSAIARFAGTHAAWTAEEAGMEDLLVSLADKIWKNKRVTELEDLVVARLAVASGRTVWEEFLDLDSVLARIGDQADERLAFQMSYSTVGNGHRLPNLPDTLTTWFAENDAVFCARGITAELRHSPEDGRLKNSAWLTVEARDRGIQITVWSSGEAELDYVDLGSGDNRPEHRDLQTDQELHALLRSALDWVAPGTNG
ncbi:HD domain-containing protein [Streptomyces sp. NBC_01363]|uniref:HD domain-containing protein n=1 Tax=Streptomyces sp. NBC_01363 TaxID=2903840 RepID=UPI002B1D7EC2|nr:HD domain-containing protein [Streptomyces sp. NBC_01363]